MKTKPVYFALLGAGLVVLVLFQNCSKANFDNIATPSVNPSSVPEIPEVPTTTQAPQAPPPTTPNIPDIVTILPPNSKWKLVDMVLDGNRSAVPTINHILLNVVLENENLRVAAEQQVGSQIKALYFIEFTQFCHPISGNYLGISSANSQELLGNPLDLQGGQFSTYTNNDDLNGPLCSSDSEAALRAEVSKQVNSMAKHTSGNLHIERRGTDLVVTVGQDIFFFSPL